MIIYVARHGETDWNREGRYQGRQESDLTETGRRQARAFAASLHGRPIDAVISSSLRRCRQSAEPLADSLSQPVRVDDRLIEIDHGTWEGHLRGEIAVRDAERFMAWQHEPQTVTFVGGESPADVRERWRAFASALSGYDEVAVVTHDVLVRIAILDATGRDVDRLWEPRVMNGGYARFESRGGRWSLLDECIQAHLSGLVVDVTTQAL